MRRWVTKARVALYGVLGGAPLLLGALGADHWAHWWLAGGVRAAAFVPVALFGPRGAAGQFAAIAPALVIISVLCTWSDALSFIPAPQLQQHPFHALFGPLARYLIVAGALTVLAVVLDPSRESIVEPLHYGPVRALLVVLL